MDALGHVFDGDALYIGFPADSMSTYGGLAHCGIEKAGPATAFTSSSSSPLPYRSPEPAAHRSTRWRSPDAAVRRQ